MDVGVCTDFYFSRRGPLRRRLASSEWNVEGGHHRVDVDGLSAFLIDGRWIDGWDRLFAVCRDAGKFIDQF